MCYVHWCGDQEECLLCGRVSPIIPKSTQINSGLEKVPTENGMILNNAIDMLGNLDSEKIETIQVNSTKYDDQSKGLTIEITYSSGLTEIEKQAKAVWEQFKENMVD